MIVDWREYSLVPIYNASIRWGVNKQKINNTPANAGIMNRHE